MSPGSAAHNASKTALTRATASSPPPSGTHIRATLLNATLQRPTVAGVHALTPKTLKAFPVRMRAADGQNAGGSFANGRQRDGWNAGWSSVLFFAGGGAGGGLAWASDPPDGAASRGGPEVCCWRCADAVALVSGWVASFSLVLSGARSSSWREWRVE